MYLLVLTSPILSEPGVHRILSADMARHLFVFNCANKLEAENGINDVLLMEFKPGQDSATSVAHIRAFKDDDGTEKWFNYQTHHSIKAPTDPNANETRDFILEGMK